MLTHAVKRCGLSPSEFWQLTWYEYNLICERAHYQEESQWNHTRHLMAALCGEKPRDIMPLSFDKTEAPQTSQADIERIRNKYKKQPSNGD